MKAILRVHSVAVDETGCVEIRHALLDRGGAFGVGADQVVLLGRIPSGHGAGGGEHFIKIMMPRLLGICFRARRAGKGQNGDVRRGVRGYGGERWRKDQ
jgi:hypothetical protein